MALAIVLFMILMLVIGMPVSFALGIAGMTGLYLFGGWDAIAGVIGSSSYATAASYTLTAVPMFILMAEFVSRSNIVDDVFAAAHRWLERLPGGLAIATIFASAGMAAMAGSSTAAAATMARVAVPNLKKYGYSDSASTGYVTVAGTLATMIPPSLGFVLYGIITETSIGKLLIAGIIPGLLCTTMYIIGILGWGRIRPGLLPPPTKLFTWRDRWSSLKPLWAFVILIVTVIGAIYSGIATAIEAAALGAFAALIIALSMRRLKAKDINDAAGATVKTTGMIFTIIIGAMILGFFLTYTQATQHLIEFVAASGLPNWVVMGFVVLLYLGLGAMMETTAILFITLPLMFPLVMSLGYSPIWFGVVVTKLTEIGLVTPPVGLNAYVVSATTGIPLQHVFRGTGMLLLMDVFSLALLLFVPALSTWLPSMVM